MNLNFLFKTLNIKYVFQIKLMLMSQISFKFILKLYTKTLF